MAKDSIKTCPNGVTYGKHGDGHWHVAVKNEDNDYYPDGDAIYTDPCLGSTEKDNTQTQGGQSSDDGKGTGELPKTGVTDDLSKNTVYLGIGLLVLGVSFSYVYNAISGTTKFAVSTTKSFYKKNKSISEQRIIDKRRSNIEELFK